MPLLRLLTPPYRAVITAADGVPPLGTIAVGSATSAEFISGSLKPLLRRAPWCVPCLVTGAETAAPRILVALHELPGHPAFLIGPLADGLLAPEGLAAVRSRPMPSGSRLADYVVRRTRRPDLRIELAHLLGEAPVSPVHMLPPERTVRDRLRRFGPLASHCWRAVGTLCRLAARMDRRPVRALAVLAGVGPRTLRVWVRRYLHVTMAEFRARVGWEWVLEASLRVAGYVEAPEPARVAGLRLTLPASQVVLPRTGIGDRRPVPRIAPGLVTEIDDVVPAQRLTDPGAPEQLTPRAPPAA